jgi:hypothetical protein
MIKAVSFLVTYQCNANCDFCECGPDAHDRLGSDAIIHYIDEAVALGTVSQVIFTGGEPTLLGDDLLNAIAYANSLGLVTRVVTNGWWGKSPKDAIRFLDKLIASGLTEINISIDDLHQRWIPLEHAKNAFLACQKRRFQCLIAHKGMRNPKITSKFLEEYFGVELIEFDPRKNYDKDEGCRLISGGVVIPVGPHSEEFTEDDLAYSSFTGNCSSILKDVVIGADHQLLACCGIVTKNLPELTLGDLREKRMIDLIEEANRDLILNWICLEGPASIATFVHKKDPSVQFADRYVNMCHLCNEVLTRKDVRAVLSNHIGEINDRIKLHRAFLEHIRNDKELINLYCK